MTAATLPAAGWYPPPDDPEDRRYWNGEAWGAPTPEDRREALAGRIAHWVSTYGYRVESQTDIQAVIVRGRRPNHLLHLILTVLTLGAWGIVWLCLAIFGGETRRTLSVDADGYPVES